MSIFFIYNHAKKKKKKIRHLSPNNGGFLSIKSPLQKERWLYG